MPLIWAAISAHGYGHAAQVVPVLNALGARVSGLRVLLRTTVPASFFQDRLTVPWDISPVQQDVGCVQHGPLAIDIDATWHHHDRFHAAWTERLAAEVAAMHAARPDLVLADTPYLALAAGKRAGLPTVALVSFTWDLILADYPAPPMIDKAALLHAIREAYASADLALRMTPAPKITACPVVQDIGPVAEPGTPARAALAAALRLAPEDKTVLVAFGGIPLTSIPFQEIDRTVRGYRFLFSGPIPNGLSSFVSTPSLPFSFTTLMASVDIIMTKPGYGTLVEAVALGTPMVYVRRYNFADEPPLVEYLHRHGRGVELSQEDFTLGSWTDALARTQRLALPPTPPLPATGADTAAQLLASHFLRT